MKTIYIKENGRKINVEVTDEVYEVMKEERRSEWRSDAKFAYYNYSLDDRFDKGIEVEDERANIENRYIDEEDKLERESYLEKLKNVIDCLSVKQMSAINKHYFLGMSYSDIAREEQVGKSTIAERIESGLKKLKKFF